MNRPPPPASPTWSGDRRGPAPAPRPQRQADEDLDQDLSAPTQKLHPGLRLVMLVVLALAAWVLAIEAGIGVYATLAWLRAHMISG